MAKKNEDEIYIMLRNSHREVTLRVTRAPSLTSARCNSPVLPQDLQMYFTYPFSQLLVVTIVCETFQSTKWLKLNLEIAKKKK